MKHYMGIDPGHSSGGIAIIDGDGKVCEVVKFEQTILDLFNQMADIDDKYDIDMCFVEKVNSYPRDSSKASFSFGYHNGVLHSSLIYAGIKHRFVRPQDWMKHFSMVRKKSEENRSWKNRLKSQAQSLFPDVKCTLWNSDALLISEYSRNFNKNT